jgi:hypothetical protein
MPPGSSVGAHGAGVVVAATFAGRDIAAGPRAIAPGVDLQVSLRVLQSGRYFPLGLGRQAAIAEAAVLASLIERHKDWLVAVAEIVGKVFAAALVERRTGGELLDRYLVHIDVERPGQHGGARGRGRSAGQALRGSADTGAAAEEVRAGGNGLRRRGIGQRDPFGAAKAGVQDQRQTLHSVFLGMG